MDILDLNDMDQITETIWLGNWNSTLNLNNLRKEGIKKILSISDYPPNINDENSFFIKKMDKISDFSNRNIIKYFGDCLNFMNGEEKTLVHCKLGTSRSATIVIAYLMWKQKMEYEEAYNYVKNKRKRIGPNSGFKEQLKIFEKLLIKNNYDINKIDFNNIDNCGNSDYFNAVSLHSRNESDVTSK